MTISSTVYKINDESVDIKTSGNISLPDTTEGNKIGKLEIESGELTIEILHAANITNNGNLNAATSVQANNIENAGEITTPTVKTTAELTNAENATIIATNGTPNFTEAQMKAADINGDGEVNAIDASLALAYYAHISTGGTLSLKNFIANKV